MRWELEEVARAALERANLGPPVDPDVLADQLGLVVRDGGIGCEGLLIGLEILVDESLRPERRAFSIAHEIAHYLARAEGLETAGVRDRRTEQQADYLASALLLPRHDFEIDLRRCGWDMLRLRARHRWASFEAVGRRIVALRDARMHVFDKPLAGQRPVSSYSVPWGLSPTEDELEAAREAVKHGNPVEVRAGVWGWPVVQHDWARAITLAPIS